MKPAARLMRSSGAGVSPQSRQCWEPDGHGEPTLHSSGRVLRVRTGRPRRAESGFSLIEMIVATLLMSVAIVGLLALITGAMSNASRVREYERAAMLARTRMNELLVQDPLPMGSQMQGEFGNDWGWEAVAEPFEILPGARPGAFMLARIHLTIWWNSENRRKTVDAEGYRRIRIRPGDDLSRLQ